MSDNFFKQLEEAGFKESDPSILNESIQKGMNISQVINRVTSPEWIYVPKSRKSPKIEKKSNYYDGLNAGSIPVIISHKDANHENWSILIFSDFVSGTNSKRKDKVERLKKIRRSREEDFDEPEEKKAKNESEKISDWINLSESMKKSDGELIFEDENPVEKVSFSKDILAEQSWLEAINSPNFKLKSLSTSSQRLSFAEMLEQCLMIINPNLKNYIPGVESSDTTTD